MVSRPNSNATNANEQNHIEISQWIVSLLQERSHSASQWATLDDLINSAKARTSSGMTVLKGRSAEAAHALEGATFLRDLVHEKEPTQSSESSSNPSKGLTSGLYFISTLIKFGHFHLVNQTYLPLKSLLAGITEPLDVLQLCNTLSIIARELDSSAESLQYLKQAEKAMPRLPAAKQAVHCFNLGNTYADLGFATDALQSYEAATKHAYAAAPEVLGPIYLQIGRLKLEQGDLEQSTRALELAQKHGSIDDRFRIGILTSAARIELLLSRNWTPAVLKSAWEQFSNMLPQVKEYLTLPEQATVHQLQSRWGQILGDGAVQEWTARMACTAMLLSGRARELGGTYSNIALALVKSQQGAESRFWLEMAMKAVKATAEEHLKADLYCTIGYIFAIFGMVEESLSCYSAGLDLKNVPADSATRLNLLAQTSYYARVQDPHYSRELEETFNSLRAQNPGHFLSNNQASFILAKDLLTREPDLLLSWPEALRRGQTRLDKSQPQLQQFLDLHGEQVHADLATMLPAELRMKRGVLYSQLCGHGFLSFLHNYMGLPPADVFEWVLRASKNPDFISRICSEHLVNPTGSRQDTRRSAGSSKSPWKKALKNFRAVLLRYHLETKNAQQLQTLGKSQDSGAREELAAFYHRWSSTLVADPFSQIDPSTLGRPQHQPPEISAEHQSFLLSPQAEELRQLVANQDVEKLLKFLSSERGLEAARLAATAPTAEKLGIQIDNFLIAELLEPLKSLCGGLAPGPVFGEYFQAGDNGWWIIMDLTEPRAVVPSLIFKMPVSRRVASEITHNVRQHLAHPQPADISNFFHIFPDFLKPIVSAVKKGRALWLRLPAPWSAIPIEQLPATATGEALVDLFDTTRIDRFENFLRVGKPKIDEGALAKFLVAGDPCGDIPTHALALPHSRKEAEALAAILGTQPLIGGNCTKRQVLARLSTCSGAHLACHCERIGDSDFPVLVLADDYLTAQELAALDLSACKFVVLSACESASGEVFGNAPLESIADALLEAGCETVIASLWAVDDETTKKQMLLLYTELLKGETVAAGMRKAFGIHLRYSEQGRLFPWIAFGKSGAIFERTEHAHH